VRLAAAPLGQAGEAFGNVTAQLGCHVALERPAQNSERLGQCWLHAVGRGRLLGALPRSSGPAGRGAALLLLDIAFSRDSGGHLLIVDRIDRELEKPRQRLGRAARRGRHLAIDEPVDLRLQAGLLQATGERVGAQALRAHQGGDEFVRLHAGEYPAAQYVLVHTRQAYALSHKLAVTMRDTTTLIKALRDRGMSQTEISRRTNIPQPRLSRWEAGEVPDAADDALRLAQLVDEIEAGGDGESAGAQQPRADEASDTTTTA
jgi:DNA-binding transcriptional regulator YiaG